MKEKETWICKNCGGKSFYTKAKGPHMGVYCSNCNKWLKWIKGGSGLKIEQTVFDELSTLDLSPAKAIIEAKEIKDEARRAYEESLNNEVPWL